MVKVTKRNISFLLSLMLYILGLYQITLGQKPEIVVQTGHSQAVWFLRFTADGKILVSGSLESIKIWDVASGIQLRSFTTGDSKFREMTLMFDGKTLVTVSYGYNTNSHKIEFWDIKTGTRIKTVNIPEQVLDGELKLSSDGKLLAINRRGSNSSGREIVIVETENGNILHTFEARYSDSPVAFNPVTDEIAIENNLIDIKTGKIKYLPIPSVEDPTKKPNETSPTVGGRGSAGAGDSFSPISDILFSPDGKTFALEIKKNLVLYDLQTGTQSWIIRGTMRWNVFNPDGKMLATYSLDNTIKLWDLESRKEIKSITKQWEGRSELAFSPDGKTFAYSPNATIKLLDTKNAANSKTLGTVTEGIVSVVFNQKSLTLASQSYSKVRLWKFNGSREFSNLEHKFTPYIRECVNSGLGVGCNVLLSFTNDGNKLITESDRKILFWDIENYSIVDKIFFFSEGYKKFYLSPNGKLFAYPSNHESYDGLRIGSIIYGDLEAEIYRMSKIGSEVNLDAQKELNRRKSYEEKYESLIKGVPVQLYSRIESLQFNNDNKMLLGLVENYHRNGVLKDETVLILIKVEDNKILANLKGNTYRFALSPKGKTLATIEIDGVRRTDYPRLQLANWDIENQTIIKSRSIAPTRLGAFQFSPNGKVLAAIHEDKIILWDADTLVELKTLSGHSGAINSISFSGDGRYLASGGTDASIKIWDVETGKEMCDLYSFNENDWLAVTPEGFFDGTPNAWKQLIWRFNNNTFDYGAVELYFNEFFYSGLLHDVLNGKSPKPKNGQELEKIDRRQPRVEIVSINSQSKEQINTQTANQHSTDKRTTTIVVEVTDNTSEKKQANHNPTSGAQDLRLFRNGSLIKIWHGDAFKLGKQEGCEQIKPAKENEPRRVRCEGIVPIIAGNNTFTAYAFNSSNVKSNDDVVSIKGAERLKRKGALYVLNIGVNDYQGISKLKYAVDDAKDLGAEMQRQQQKLQNYASTEVVSLTDAEATKENILLALRRFRTDAEKELPQNAPKQLERIKQLAPEDALLISFSGHGVADGERFYLLPQDYNSSKLKESAVSDIELNETLEKVDAGQLLLIIDACQSGQALGQDKEGRGPMNSKGLAQLAYDKGMYILTAAQSYQAAFEVSRTLTGKDIKHGLLSFALLEALTTKKAADTNGNLLDRNWFNYAVEEVPRMQIEEMKKRQGKGSELLFSNNDNKNVEVEKRRVQTPRIFYRREESQNPFIVAKP